MGVGELVCWHFARILHKLARFMRRGLRFARKRLEIAAGTWIWCGIDTKLSSLATNFLLFPLPPHPLIYLLFSVETHPENAISLCALPSLSHAHYAHSFFGVEKSMEYAKYCGTGIRLSQQGDSSNPQSIPETLSKWNVNLNSVFFVFSVAKGPPSCWLSRFFFRF